MPAFSGGYAAGGAAIAVRKKYFRAGGKRKALYAFMRRVRVCCCSVFRAVHAGVRYRSVFFRACTRVLLFGVLCLPCGQCCCVAAVVPFSVFFVPACRRCCCVAVRCSVPSMRAALLRCDAAPHGGGNGFLLRSFQGSRRLCLFGFLLICSNFKKSPNSAVSLGSNRIHFPSRYVCALS